MRDRSDSATPQIFILTLFISDERIFDRDIGAWHTKFRVGRFLVHLRENCHIMVIVSQLRKSLNM